MDLDILKIDLKGLADGLNSFEFDLDDAYFKAVNAPEVGRGNVHVSLKIVRTQNDYFTLDFHEKGTVVLPCDLCLDDMEQPIETQQRLEAKFGNAYSEDGDLVTVPENEGILDVSWFVYEFILLALPIKHVHAPGKCNPAMISMLEAHSATRSSGDEDENAVDPRWEALSDLRLEE